MALAFDASTHGGTNASTTSLSITHTAAGSNRIAVVKVYHSTGGGATLTGVTYDGAACTNIDTQSNGSGFNESLWYLIAPSTTAGASVVATFSAAAFCTMAVSTYTGAMQSSQPDASGKSSATTTGLTVSATVLKTNCWLVGGFETNTTGIDGGTGTTRRSTNSDAGNGYSSMICDSNAIVARGSQSLVSSHGSALTVGVVASIAATDSALPATSSKFASNRTLLGVG